MKSVIAIRHVHFEDLGTIEPLLAERGYAVRYIDAAIEDLTMIDPIEPALLVFLGGPIGAFDDAIYPFLVNELELVRRRLEAQLPTLGICLGAQLMARVMGAKVEPMGLKEIGFSALTLTEAGGSSALAEIGSTPVLHWHGDQFEIPREAARLAASTVCANQAFLIDDFALGLQFHLEADLVMIENWLVGHASELNQAGVDPRTLRETSRQNRTLLERAAHKVMNVWLDQAGLVRINT
ncbi:MULTISPECIES: glutamine amidotransferase [Burkholderiaceae]|uniref:Glutamine amidotransferase, class I n=1 Tax=Caballeronia sordidicola TaxID=196367 RepID=A0A242MNG3_CABSO|nr:MULTISPECIES: glutamine amidotransferase [Burkholderiaceae]AME28095.1 glutamine amidotransferase [Burkholderia sp. PAMC 26561]OTP72859.1 Glutamine amidotransferase, class I [Caballeronia sordidicola]